MRCPTYGAVMTVPDREPRPLTTAIWLDEWEAKLEWGQRSAHQAENDDAWQFYSGAMDEIERLKGAMGYWHRNPYGEVLVRVDFLA